MTEFTGQLIGGPNEGNFVTASVSEIRFIYYTSSYLDGPECQSFRHYIEGIYKWDDNEKCFRWNEIINKTNETLSPIAKIDSKNE
jgi:hypothetical protein